MGRRYKIIIAYQILPFWGFPKPSLKVDSSTLNPQAIFLFWLNFLGRVFLLSIREIRLRFILSGQRLAFGLSHVLPVSV